ncbi:hypothetical protein B9T38_10220 [Acinetobacter sp. ANC 4218]|uniref:hypothetical protein n=1 Tax=Acinetobacter sp. ANC 4218 TaxID=1977880 RepID=UPI000A35500E|nr:hypothetical protein [Acinetobacter sp. ANC 4218]OTG71167.1 hypothetical protein B9T38_10220 [Acinetobacter sp. ANC 4218]
MDLTSELLLKFPATQISTLKNFKKSRIIIHPRAYGFNLCYLNMFKNLTADLDISNRIKELHVWKTSEFDSYTILNNIHLYISYLNQDIKEITLIVHHQQSFSDDELAFLMELCSREFIHFIKTSKFDIRSLNPRKTLHLINTHLSRQTLLILNKQSSLKPHHQMSLELLAQLLSCSRNQLNQRIKNIKQERTQIFNQLSLHSSCVKELIDRPASCLSTEKIWRS